MALETRIINVEGMSCNHCVNAIQNAVGELNGVKEVQINLESKKVTVDYDDERVSLETIMDTIEDQGYDVTR